MTITVHVSPETERKLQDRAAQAGQSLERFIAGHVEELARRGDRGQAPAAPQTWEEICAPIAAAVQGSTMTDEQFAAFIEEVREEVCQEKQAKPGQPA